MTKLHSFSYSVVIPAYNEAGAVGAVIRDLLELKGIDLEIIIVDDHSHDGTKEEAAKHPITLLSNIQNSGYGYSLKRGIRAATRDHIIILDADGSYPVSSIPELAHEYEKGFDMVVGARKGRYYHGSRMKKIARFFFCIISEFVTGRRIPDVNSGFRIFRKEYALRFFNTLSNGFSFTTTITLAFMLNSYTVTYMPIEYHKREGSSKVRYMRDTLRALQIIIESIVFYNPLKLYLLLAVLMLIAGIVGAVVSMWSPAIALIVVGSVASALTICAIGLLAVFLRFVHTSSNDTRKSEEV